MAAHGRERRSSVSDALLRSVALYWLARLTQRRIRMMALGPALDRILGSGQSGDRRLRSGAQRCADPDLDGVVTTLEPPGLRRSGSNMLDEDRDRAIHGPEFLRAAAVRSPYALDGFAQSRPLAFESLDVDGNGMLTPEEILRAEVLRRSLAATGVTDAAAAGDLRPWSTAIATFVLSEQEFTDAGRQDFGSADGNGDGKVTIWEFLRRDAPVAPACQPRESSPSGPRDVRRGRRAR